MRFRQKFLTASLLFVLLAGVPRLPAQATPTDPLHAWKGGNDPAQLEAWVNQRLAAEKAAIDKLLAVAGPGTVENTLRPFDNAQNELAIAGNNAYLLFSVGDTAPLRDKAQAMQAVVSSADTDLSLHQKVYKRLAALPMTNRVYNRLAPSPWPPNAPAPRHYIERTLLAYRLSGVDKDDATRAQ